jgi:membrane-bound serine protease (ClpP class)
MAATTRHPVGSLGRARRASCLVALAVVLSLTPAAARADGPAPESGLFITVGNPLTSEEYSRIKAKVERNLNRTDRRVRKIVFDFNPDRHASSTKEFGPCHDLAKFILRLQDVTTIAFVHNETTGHTVLPVLACHELVMSSRAKLGDVMRGQTDRLTKSEVQAYHDVAEQRGRPLALVLKMIDPDVEVLQGMTRQGGTWYIDRRHEAEEVQRGFVLKSREPVLRAGEPGLYTAATARKLDLCQRETESREQVAEMYRLAPSSLREDPLEGRTPSAWRAVVRGNLTRGQTESLQRSIRTAVARGANFILLQLECGGADTLAARDFADFLRTLRDDLGQNPVMTVAYVPDRREDSGVLTFVAFGCSEIVMGPHAELGNFENVVFRGRGNARQEANPREYQMVRESLEGLAQVQGYSPLLARAMLDRNLILYRVQSRKNPSEWRLISGEDWAKEQERDDSPWTNPQTIKPGGPDGKLLKLNATLAKELGVAQEIVPDLAGVYAHYGLKQVRDVGTDWLASLAAFLRHPLMAVLLVMVGIACLILELKMPGVGLPGVIAALCFVLYFWAHSQLAGQITMLAILLFVLGLILIGLEIFVLPGFGVTGISGILLLILSLGLVTLEKKPETTQEWLDFGKTLSTFGLGLLGAVAAALLAAWYLPHIPYANRLVLKPPGEEPELAEGELDGEGRGPAVSSEVAALLGAIGVAVTPLRPAGMVRFGDAFVDVVAEGSYVPEGNRVQVVEIEGNRIVVKEV